MEDRFDDDRVIDIEGKFMAPGYIDVHTHTDGTVMGDDEEIKAALNLLYQGITTVSLGADGRHSLKYTDQYAEHMPFTNSGNSPMNLAVIPEKY
jgi:N-acyl-D-amino-acid deacylase